MDSTSLTEYNRIDHICRFNEGVVKMAMAAPSNSKNLYSEEQTRVMINNLMIHQNTGAFRGLVDNVDNKDEVTKVAKDFELSEATTDGTVVLYRKIRSTTNKKRLMVATRSIAFDIIEVTCSALRRNGTMSTDVQRITKEIKQKYWNIGQKYVELWIQTRTLTVDDSMNVSQSTDRPTSGTLLTIDSMNGSQSNDPSPGDAIMSNRSDFSDGSHLNQSKVDQQEQKFTTKATDKNGDTPTTSGTSGTLLTVDSMNGSQSTDPSPYDVIMSNTSAFSDGSHFDQSKMDQQQQKFATKATDKNEDTLTSGASGTPPTATVDSTMNGSQSTPTRSSPSLPVDSQTEHVLVLDFIDYGANKCLDDSGRLVTILMFAVFQEKQGTVNTSPIESINPNVVASFLKKIVSTKTGVVKVIMDAARQDLSDKLRMVWDYWNLHHRDLVMIEFLVDSSLMVGMPGFRRGSVTTLQQYLAKRIWAQHHHNVARDIIMSKSLNQDNGPPQWELLIVHGLHNNANTTVDMLTPVAVDSVITTIQVYIPWRDAFEYKPDPAKAHGSGDFRCKALYPCSLLCQSCAIDSPNERPNIGVWDHPAYSEWLIADQSRYFETDWIYSFCVLTQHDVHCLFTAYYPFFSGQCFGYKRIETYPNGVFPVFATRAISTPWCGSHYAVFDMDIANKRIMVYDGLCKSQQHLVKHWTKTAIGLLCHVAFLKNENQGLGGWELIRARTYRQQDRSSCGAIASIIVESLFRHGYLHPRYLLMTEQDVRRYVLERYEKLLKQHSRSVVYKHRTLAWKKVMAKDENKRDMIVYPIPNIVSRPNKVAPELVTIEESPTKENGGDMIMDGID